MATKQILSPLPGTFYRKPAPDKPVYKSDGDTVAAGEVIGLVEVMKSFNEVKADVGGKIAQLGSRLIDATAKKLAGEFFDNFADVVAPPEPGAETAKMDDGEAAKKKGWFRTMFAKKAG